MVQTLYCISSATETSVAGNSPSSFDDFPIDAAAALPEPVSAQGGAAMGCYLQPESEFGARNLGFHQQKPGVKQHKHDDRLGPSDIKLITLSVIIQSKYDIPQKYVAG